MSNAEKLRDEVRLSDSKIRGEVLRGAFNADTAPASRWKPPSSKLLMFVSSPFTDTKNEREFLLDDLLFEMRNIGQEYAIQVIFADMRWGIRDQNTLDHKITPSIPPYSKC